MAQDQLATAELGTFQLPLNPSYRLGDVRCPRVMDSKKLPLWLTFTNADEPGSEINVIFKWYAHQSGGRKRRKKKRGRGGGGINNLNDENRKRESMPGSYLLVSFL
jgi:hypothetical protein